MVDPSLVRQLLGDSLSYLYPAALRVAARFAVADHLAGGPMTGEELAALTGVQSGPLTRVLRLLATRGVFRLDEAGRFHQTPTSALLGTNSQVSLRSLVLLFTDEMYWRAAGRLDDTVASGASAFADIFSQPFFDYLPTDAQRERLFSAALSDLSSIEQQGIVDSYPFPASGTVVDVAGGHGAFLKTILTRRPGLHGVLFDRASVLSGHVLEDAAVTGRWSIADGDMFVAVPEKADIYLLKRIAHDKSDDELDCILRCVRRAMHAKSRLLIIDAVVAPDGQMPPGLVMADVLMMTVWNGRERTEREFSELLAQTKLRLSRVVTTPTPLSIIEAVPSPDADS